MEWNTHKFIYHTDDLFFLFYEKKMILIQRKKDKWRILTSIV